LLTRSFTAGHPDASDGVGGVTSRTVMAVPPTTYSPVPTDLLFEKAGVGLCLVAPDGTVLRTNAEWLRSTGYAAEQVIGENILELFSETRDMALTLHARARAGHRVEVPRHAQWVNGRETWWEESVAPVPMEGGMGLLITSREVTDGAWSFRGVTGREGADEELRASEERFRAFFHTAAVGTAELSLDGRFIEVNERMCKLTGYGRAELLGMRPADLTHPGDRAREDLKLSAYLRGEAPTYEAEKRYVRKDGTVIWVQVWAAIIRDASGRASRSAGIIQDITERKRSEEALRRHELVVQQSRDVILFMRHEDGRIVEANPAATVAYGYTRDELLNLTIHDLREPETRALVGSQMTEADARGALFESVHRRKDGSTFPVEVSSRGVTVDGTHMLISVVRDITERKRAEEALRESEERLRAAFAASPDAINVNRLRDGAYVAVNRRFEQLSLWPREEAMGKTVVDLNVWVDWGERERQMARLLSTGRVENAETAFRRKDGTVFTASISAQMFEVNGERFLLAITRDISDLKRAEHTLREADRRKDEFLGMLSHELRNPLAPIRNSLYLLDHAEPDSQQARRAKEIANRQIAHMTRLVDDLLDVTRVAHGKIELRREKIDLREVVWRAADDYRLLVTERGVTFHMSLPNAKVWVDADATRITQVVGNLLHNAAKFSRRGEDVVLSLRTMDQHAEISVRDTGAGIEPALLPKIFDAFTQGTRTLARTEGGLGLGLALAKGIAELHGGSVEARSAGKGKGSEFIVRLPLGAVADTEPRQAPEVQRRHESRRVLVVDDNPDAAESLADLLRMLGHSVEVAYDGPMAIERARANPPDVVLCDIGLPGMSGYDVAQALRATAAERMRLIALSGYAQPEDVKHAIEAGFDVHVAKPCDPEEIERLLA
jgi:PAS domain S-box-containing protein